VRRTRMRSCNGVNVVVATAVGIASLLLVAIKVVKPGEPARGEPASEWVAGLGALALNPFEC